jgi:hypothetical protein
MHRAHIPAMRWDMAEREDVVRNVDRNVASKLNSMMSTTGREHFACRSYDLNSHFTEYDGVWI